MHCSAQNSIIQKKLIVWYSGMALVLCGSTRRIYSKIFSLKFLLFMIRLRGAADICCVSGCFKSLWRSIWGREIVAGVNQTVFRMYGTKPYQFEPTYPLREEPAQKEERSASILHHKFQKHPLTLQFCIVAPDLLPHMFFNHEAQHVNNMFENWLSIPLRFT